MRWHYAMNSLPLQASPVEITALQKSCPFHNKRNEPPKNLIDVEKRIQGLQADLQRLVSQHTPKIKSNATTAERRAITTLSQTDNVTITKSDKGGEIVVMPTSDLHHLCNEHLGDKSTYEQLSKNPTNDIRFRGVTREGHEGRAHPH